MECTGAPATLEYPRTYQLQQQQFYRQEWGDEFEMRFLDYDELALSSLKIAVQPALMHASHAHSKSSCWLRARP